MSRIRRVAKRLEVALPDPAGTLATADIRDFADERAALEARLDPIESSVDDLWQRLSEARAGAARARDSRKHAELLRRGAVDMTRLSGLRFTTVSLGLIRVEELPSLATVLAPAPFAILPLDIAEGRALAAIALPTAVRDRLESALRVVSFEELPLAAGSQDPAHADAALRNAEDAERTAFEALGMLHSQCASTLVELARRADLGVFLLQAQTHFAASGRYVVISGWIPEDRAAGMTRAIGAVTEGRAVVDVEKPQDMTNAFASALGIPILYRNPLLLRPFQTLVQMYGVPSYGEVQPTGFFAVSFLLMFGLMFGDVGQGLVLFSAGYCLFRYLPRFLDYGILLMECGAASMVFGALYGSFFGVEGLLPVLWIEPIRDMRRFMAVAIGFGVLLVSIGLLLNIVNSWRSGERASALLGPHGVFGAFTYWILVALLARAVMPANLTLPVPLLLGMMVVPVVLLVFKRPIVRLLERGGPARVEHPGSPRWLAALEGSVELVDSIFSFFANTISFVRVAAFAAVHAGVFIAMFALADTLAHFRFGQPLGIITLVVGNVVMIFLEGLTVSVQVLRLESYEFFGKFFRGGGEPYRPLMLRKGGM